MHALQYPLIKANPCFAQEIAMGKSAGPPPELIVFWLIMGVAGLIGLGIQILYLLTLSKALSRCSQHNRTMEPGMVWLILIPLFGLIWIFITVNRIAESLRNEFQDRRMDRGGEDYGQSLGTTYAALMLGGIIPCLGFLLVVAGFICWIMYWVKIAGFSGELAAAGDRGGYGDDYDRGGYGDRDRGGYGGRDRDRDRYDDRDRGRDRDRDRGGEGYRDRWGDRGEDDRYR
jgi:hypothetical protein